VMTSASVFVAGYLRPAPDSAAAVDRIATEGSVEGADEEQAKGEGYAASGLCIEPGEAAS
jgi:hypothetical protein